MTDLIARADVDVDVDVDVEEGRDVVGTENFKLKYGDSIMFSEHLRQAVGNRLSTSFVPEYHSSFRGLNCRYTDYLRKYQTHVNRVRLGLLQVSMEMAKAHSAQQLARRDQKDNAAAAFVGCIIILTPVAMAFLLTVLYNLAFAFMSVLAMLIKGVYVVIPSLNRNAEQHNLLFEAISLHLSTAFQTLVIVPGSLQYVNAQGVSSLEYLFLQWAKMPEGIQRLLTTIVTYDEAHTLAIEPVVNKVYFSKAEKGPCLVLSCEPSGQVMVRTLSNKTVNTSTAQLQMIKIQDCRLTPIILQDVFQCCFMVFLSLIEADLRPSLEHMSDKVCKRLLRHTQVNPTIWLVKFQGANPLTIDSRFENIKIKKQFRLDQLPEPL